ncbi:MAG: hypothetical protein MUF16_25225, partial [Burkholderiaceae bacterium]|nr:hypothetical protein [Burkholderiaceae bacterium]
MAPPTLDATRKGMDRFWDLALRARLSGIKRSRRPTLALEGRRAAAPRSGHVRRRCVGIEQRFARVVPQAQ